MTERSEVSGFEDEVSINSPLLSSGIIGVKNFDDNFFGDEIEEEQQANGKKMTKDSGLFGKQPNNHAATLQLITFINEHNLTEDSADKLLKIFSMGPKIS